MQHRQLGHDGPMVPVLGFGAWPIGGGMGEVDEATAIAAIHAALDGGITLIDTAQSYRTDVRFFCHGPVIISDDDELLGDVLLRLRVQPEGAGDDVVDRDIILLWGRSRRVITGADILGRLLRGIARRSRSR